MHKIIDHLDSNTELLRHFRLAARGNHPAKLTQNFFMAVNLGHEHNITPIRVKSSIAKLKLFFAAVENKQFSARDRIDGDLFHGDRLFPHIGRKIPGPGIRIRVAENLFEGLF